MICDVCGHIIEPPITMYQGKAYCSYACFVAKNEMQRTRTDNTI